MCSTGSKSFVVCSKFANLLIVVAKKSGEFVERIENEDDIKLNFQLSDKATNDIDDDDYLTFIVDMDSSGITVTEETTSFGLQTIPFASINFANVRLSKGRILSESADGRQATRKLIEHSRLQSSIANMVLAKEMLKHFIKYTTNATCFSQKIRYFSNFPRRVNIRYLSSFFGVV